MREMVVMRLLVYWLAMLACSIWLINYGLGSEIEFVDYNTALFDGEPYRISGIDSFILLNDTQNAWVMDKLGNMHPNGCMVIDGQIVLEEDGFVLNHDIFQLVWNASRGQMQ